MDDRGGTRGHRRTVLTRLALTGLVTVVLTAGCTSPSSAPSPSSSPPATAAAPPIYLPECITAADGTPARVTTTRGFSDGVLMGQGAKGVVIAHQTDDGPCAYIDFARDLVRRGYHVALYSQTDPDLEIPGWVDQLSAAGATKVVLFGASIGAMGAIQVAPEHSPPVSGVISLSALRGVGSGTYVEDAAARLELPVLFVAAADDPDDAAPAARSFMKVCPSTDKKLLIVPGADHGMSMTEAESGRRVLAAVHAFLAAHA